MKDSRMNVLKCIDDYRKLHKTGPSFKVIGKNVGLGTTAVLNQLDHLEDDDWITSEHVPDLMPTGRRSKRKPGTLDLTPLGREKLVEYLVNGQLNDNDEDEVPPSETSNPSKKLFVGVDYIVMSARLSAFENIQYVDIPILDTIAASFDAGVGTNSGFGPEYALRINENMIPERYKHGGLYALEVKGNSMIEVGVCSGDYVILKPTQEAQNGDMCAIRIGDDEATLKFFYREKDCFRLKPANKHLEPKTYGADKEVQIQGKVIMVVRH
jgi:SOS-response transcriptional repressor LexA